MTLKVAQFESALAELIEVPNPDPLNKNPFLTMAKFIFADDKGNKNNQGIEYEDFPQVAVSAIDMPVKINYSPLSGTQNHADSIPIGHIKAMDINEEERLLIATAMLYADEFPQEITYLKTSFAEGNAPGVSWELAYEDGLIKNGVEWLKGIITKAVTFVRHPAYGSRTALLAVAETQEFQQYLKDFLEARAVGDKQQPPIVKDEGGSQVTEEELQALKEALKAEAEAKVAEATSRIQDLEGQLSERDARITELETKITTMEKATLVAVRTQKFEAAGLPIEADAEKLSKKQEFWVSLSDEAFEEYLSDLITAKQVGSKSAQAAERGKNLPEIPKFAYAETDINLETMKSELRKLARS